MKDFTLNELMYSGSDPFKEPQVCSKDLSRAEALEKLRITVETFLHEIDNHDDDKGPILMDNLMWMSVEAMRKLTKSL